EAEAVVSGHVGVDEPGHRPPSGVRVKAAVAGIACRVQADELRARARKDAGLGVVARFDIGAVHPATTRSETVVVPGRHDAHGLDHPRRLGREAPAVVAQGDGPKAQLAPAAGDADREASDLARSFDRTERGARAAVATVELDPGSVPPDVRGDRVAVQAEQSSRAEDDADLERIADEVVSQLADLAGPDRLLALRDVD